MSVRKLGNQQDVYDVDAAAAIDVASRRIAKRPRAARHLCHELSVAEIDCTTFSAFSAYPKITRALCPSRSARAVMGASHPLQRPTSRQETATGRHRSATAACATVVKPAKSR